MDLPAPETDVIGLASLPPPTAPVVRPDLEASAPPREPSAFLPKDDIGIDRCAAVPTGRKAVLGPRP